LSIFDISKNEKLSNEAFQVFETNKFLDFKNKDTLIEIINDTVYKKTVLNNFFSYQKDWNEIENETFETYKQNKKGYKYIFLDNTMIETYSKIGSYNVNREIKTIYNSKGFIIYQEEKVFVGDLHNETRITINEFDKKNRVIRIIEKTERTKKEENTSKLIEVKYNDDNILITSENGTIICKFIIE